MNCLVGPNKIIQTAIPNILQHTTPVWHEAQNQKLAKAADLFYEEISKASGLTPIMPNGAMYMMV